MSVSYHKKTNSFHLSSNPSNIVQRKCDLYEIKDLSFLIPQKKIYKKESPQKTGFIEEMKKSINLQMEKVKEIRANRNKFDDIINLECQNLDNKYQQKTIKKSPKFSNDYSRSYNFNEKRRTIEIKMSRIRDKIKELKTNLIYENTINNMYNDLDNLINDFNYFINLKSDS